MASPQAGWALRTLLGAALVVAGIWIGGEPVKDGGRTLTGWFVAMFGLPLAIRVRGPWMPVTFLAGSFVFGAIGQLGITDPLWLQHLRISPSEFPKGWDRAFLLPIVLQALTVGIVAWSFVRGGSVRSWLPPIRRIRWPAAAGAAVLFVASAAHLSRYVDKPHFAAASYVAQVLVTACFFALNLANLFLIVVAVPPEDARSLRDRLTRPDLDRALPWILAGFVFVASLALGFFALDFVPHIPDEISYLFQAECFARGTLFGKAPPSPEAFDVYLVTTEGDRWFATTPPGWPAVLAIGCALGMPWIVNPLLGALSIPLAHALTRRLLGPRQAHLAALLLSVSPWLLFLSASFMTHALSLFLALAAWLCLARARGAPEAPSPGPLGAQASPGAARKNRLPEEAAGEANRTPSPPPPPATAALWALLSGALLGWLALVRQLDAVLVAFVAGLWALGLFGRRLPWSAILAFGAGVVAIASLILPFNAAMTGKATEFPINAYLDELWYPGANRLGFGADVGNPPGWGDLDAFPGHGLRDVLINTNQNLYATNYELFGWGIGSLFFAALHLLLARKTRLDKLMIFWVAVLLLGYHLYWYSGGPDFGARYWYLMIYPLVVLTLRGIEACVDGLRSRAAGDTAPLRVGVAIAVLTFTTLAVFVSWRAVGRYKDYRGFHADYRGLDLPGDALVLVRSARNSDFWSAFIRNSPDQSERRPIFAQDVGEASNQRLIEAFPDRPVVFVTGRSAGGGPTRITGTRPPRSPR